MKKPAFSLVELLVSVMVISIIAVAFAPIVTKKITKNLAVIGKEEVTKNNIEPGEKLFVVSDCTLEDETTASYGQYAKCTFTVPDKITSIGVVAVGGGGGGGGALKGPSTLETKSIIADSSNKTVTLNVDSTMSNFKIDTIISAGGGGGGGASNYPGTGSGGAGGASGIYRGNCPFNSTPPSPYSDYTLKRVTITAGTGGGTSNGWNPVGGNCNEGENGSTGGTSSVVAIYAKGTSEVEFYHKTWGGYGGAHGTACDSTGYIESDYSYNVTYAPTYAQALGYVGGDAAEGMSNYNLISGCSLGGIVTQNHSENGRSPNIYGAGGTISTSYTSLASTYGRGGRGGRGNGNPNDPYNEPANGTDGYVKVTYSQGANYKGGAGAAGTSGGIIHVTDFPVTPGQECTIYVGKGGAAGTSGSSSTTGKNAGRSIVECGSNKIVTGWIYISGNHAWNYPSNDRDAFQGDTLAGNGGNGGVTIDGTRYASLNAFIKKYTENVYNYTDGTYSPQPKVESMGAKGGTGSLAPTGCGRALSYYDRASTTPEYVTPTSAYDVINGNYGCAGAAGAGGSWNSSTNSVTQPSAGQDGYVLIYWGI